MEANMIATSRARFADPWTFAIRVRDREVGGVAGGAMDHEREVIEVMDSSDEVIEVMDSSDDDEDNITGKRRHEVTSEDADGDDIDEDDSSKRHHSEEHADVPYDTSKVFNDPALLKLTLAFAGSSITVRSTCVSFSKAQASTLTPVTDAILSMALVTWSLANKLPPFPAMLGYARFGEATAIATLLKNHKWKRGHLTKCAMEAVRHGHVASLQLFVDRGCDQRNICYMAAQLGRLDVLQFARTKNCPWNVGTCEAAARNGHLEVLQWARANGCPWNARICAAAAAGGHLTVLEWARSIDTPCPWLESTCIAAAERGHLAILRYAREHSCPCTTKTCEAAARSGQAEVLQWVQENGCEWSTSECEDAAANGDLKMLQNARAKGCNWNKTVCEWAAQEGHLDVLQYARSGEFPCPWDEDTCKFAALRGHMRILKWARENG